MKGLQILVSSILALGALADPSAQMDKRADRGSYTVSGLGQRKQAILDAGGNTLDLAIAMLETSPGIDQFSEGMTTDYVYGDAKTRDAANFGLFKQNWGLLRVCADRAGFVGQSEDDFFGLASKIYPLTQVSVPSSDVYADVASRWDCQEHYGEQKWFAGHRNGESGLNNPNTQDINNYKNAVYWIKEQIDSNPAHKSDDTRFWVDVVAI
ncbi:predicted protein [Aspergillus nidulans FGSC A4]|uniref:Uncharacterized protein n=1 Tax=Emericella nidulans (strain FGSC A4 / ATCC 38163 / CBS 112.46 / NRRL 194 / M139) TaxID=227321 RepID=Q5AXZ7_EMENI|nr:hypothetical protein [Aspergillus nidulans FGSC A4]EAA58232.1 predicted protein [Aspergillus nidulans FGSC A4]CBF71552.1 TPA: hypothetical protein ANIA_06833 [Aspergillus nidulans FGSC A4]|eukprot:XP_664437.1 predicted protein [Aspergillus nidulans FGSC A4]